MKTGFAKISFLFIFTLISLNAFSQLGNINGKVFDTKTGESLPGVTIFLEGTSIGTMSDFDGKFHISAPAGIYKIRVSYVSYKTVNIDSVIVDPKDEVNLDNIALSDATTDLNVVVITAEQVKNTETAMQTMKMKSVNLLDGVSAVQFKRTGDSDAAASVKRVPGISISNGKYVYVRGLGDRYTKTMMNGLDIPGLDPDRNTIQMDIFPTSIIDNIIVHKSFRAKLPADFTGGVVDINTKEFPATKKSDISISLGYNPNFHFNNNYLSYNGGSTDFLGFDDGTRAIPATKNIPQFAEVVGNPNGPKAELYKKILSSFNPSLSAIRKSNLMDFGIGFTYGNQKNKENHTLGYNFLLSYKNTTEYYEDAVFSRWGLSGDPDVYEMDRREYQYGDYGVNNVFLSGMFGIALKRQHSKYKINLLHLQNGESKAGIFDFVGSDEGSNFTAMQHNLDYSQRSLSNLLIEGKHFLADNKWTAVWKLAPSFSKISDPDIRFTRYEVRESGYFIGTESGFPERIWRNLQEININGLLDITKEYKAFHQKAKVLFGTAYTFKERDFDIKSFSLNIRDIPLTGNPDELFYDENLWPYNGDATSGTTFETPFIPNNPNQFNATVGNIAGYLSTEVSPSEKFKAIVGVRVENYVQRYTGQDQLGINVLDNDIVLDGIDFFPSLNLIYNLGEKQNLRMSYSKTIARPSLKELSYAEIYDPISGATFIGGLFRDANDLAGIEYWDGNLVSSDIHNADLRWEIFAQKEQTVSFSTFYKYFINPIELVQFVTQTGAFQPRNVGDGQVLGLELEFRQNLSRIHKKLENLSFNTNITFVQSQIELSKTEYDSRIENARTGQTVEKDRDMAGQAPYIINSGLQYKFAKDSKYDSFEFGLYYNVQGPALMYVGIADRPDIYTKPFHSLNFNGSMMVGKEKRVSLGFKISNILNQSRATVFQSYNTQDQLYQSLNKGTTFSFKLGYRLF